MQHTKIANHNETAQTHRECAVARNTPTAQRETQRGLPPPCPAVAAPPALALTRRRSAFRAFALLALCAGFLLALAAPRAAAQSGKPPPMLNIRFSIISFEDDIPDARYGSEKSSEPLLIPGAFKPAPKRYIGPMPMHIFRQPKDAGAPATLIASISPPALTGDYLIVVSKNPAAPGTYKTLIVPDILSVAGNNKWQFINLTPYPMALRFVEANSTNLLIDGQKEGYVRPGKSFIKMMGDKNLHYDGKTYLLVRGSDGKDAWQIGYSTRYFYAAGRSKLFIFQQDPSTPSRLALKAMMAEPIREESAPTRRSGTARPAGTTTPRRR